MLMSEKVTSCCFETAEDDGRYHEKDQHGTHCPLVDLDKVEARAFRVGYLVLRPLLVTDLLYVFP